MCHSNATSHFFAIRDSFWRCLAHTFLLYHAQPPCITPFLWILFQLLHSFSSELSVFFSFPPRRLSPCQPFLFSICLSLAAIPSLSNPHFFSVSLSSSMFVAPAIVSIDSPIRAERFGNIVSRTFERQPEMVFHKFVRVMQIVITCGDLAVCYFVIYCCAGSIGAIHLRPSTF